MNYLFRYFLMASTLAFFAGCKQEKKKISLAGDQPVSLTDFIEFFPPVTLVYQEEDSIFQKKENDSLLISYKVFTSAVPDSVLNKLFGKGVKPRIYPLGKVAVPKKETYLFVKAITGSKKTVLILSFNKDNRFIAGKVALEQDQLSSTSQSFSFDRSYALIKTVVRKNKDGTTSEGKDVFALDANAGQFKLVMTDPLDDKITKLINPIDTLPRTSKIAADYTNGKMNLVSVRDGRKSNRVNFFIHFETKNAECTGELKGVAILVKPNLAEYRESGDPCVLQLIFSSTSVTLREVEGCGSRRGLNCSFNGSFRKVKNSKPASKKTIKK